MKEGEERGRSRAKNVRNDWDLTIIIIHVDKGAAVVCAGQSAPMLVHLKQ